MLVECLTQNDNELTRHLTGFAQSHNSNFKFIKCSKEPDNELTRHLRGIAQTQHSNFELIECSKEPDNELTRHPRGVAIQYFSLSDVLGKTNSCKLATCTVDTNQSTAAFQWFITPARSRTQPHDDNEMLTRC